MIGVVGALLFVMLGASTPATRGRQSPQQPVYRGGTTIVEVDAIVRDKNRQFVADLTRDDFEVLEDGTPQRIETFYLVRGPELTRPAGQPAVSPSPTLPALQTQRVLVLFFDLEHITPGGVDRARTAAQEFLGKDFLPGDIGGVVSGGRLVDNRLTNVREELEAGVRSIRPLGDSRSRQLDLRTWPRFTDAVEAYRADRLDEEVISRVVSRACYEEPDQCKGGAPVREIVLQKARQHVSEFRAAGMRTLRTVGGVVDGLAKIPGRKTIILLSDGFFTENATEEVRQLVGLAARASVRIYSLDTRGLNRGSASSDIIDAPLPRMPGDRLPDVNALSDGPNSLAVDTGGVAIRNENNFTSALDEIDRDTSSYYVLGYRPVNAKLDGQFRALTVRVKRAGASTRSRKGYLALPGQGGQEGRGGQVGAAAPPPATDRAVAVLRNVENPPAVTSPAPPPAATATVRSRLLSDEAVEGAKPSPLRLRPDLPAEIARLADSAGRAGGGAGTTSLRLPDALAQQATAGWEAYQRGDVKGAKAGLVAAASHPSARPWMRYVLGWAEYALSEYAAAVTSWEQVRQAVPEFQAVYFDLVDGYLQQGEYGQAVTVLRAAEQRWPRDVEVYNALGVVQLGRGAIDDAVKSFEKGVAIDPNDATASYNLAKTHELRYARSQRLRQVSRSTVNTVLEDRNLAIEYYRRTVALGGPLLESAREGLKRLGGQ
jgi:VWFA-related protein